MNAGKTLFSRLMDFLPWSTFNRYVTRYSGDKGVRTLSCAEQFRVMAFAQLTYREKHRTSEKRLKISLFERPPWEKWNVEKGATAPVQA